MSPVLLGYLDSNQEQLMRAGLPVSAASLPQVPRDFAEVGECSLRVARADPGCFWHLPGVCGTPS